MNARSTEEAPSTAEPRLVVVMGVSGSGKSTIGPLLARALGCPFVEGDELHPRANIEKMSRGEPLTDGDRAPWLAAIRARLVDAFERGQCIVIASSALKRAYRLELANGLPVAWVHLHGPAEVIRQRLERRAGHFMGAGMLRSQLATLEPPADAIVADITQPPDAIVGQILAALRGVRSGRVDRPPTVARADDMEGMMQLGLIGLGRMGAGLAGRLMANGHEVVGFDLSAESVRDLTRAGGTGAGSLEELVARLAAPRAVWIMVPHGEPTRQTIASLVELLGADDIVIDGGNSHFPDAKVHAARCAERGVHFLDVGVSGGVWGEKEGFNLMIGGPRVAYERLEPIFRALAAPGGYLHVGASGAGHFVKMMHNAIEYAMLQALGEGFECMRRSEFDLDLAKIAELWRHGAVVRSWLLDLLARALAEEGNALEHIAAHVDDSGTGRWAVDYALAAGIPVPAISISLFERFDSRTPTRYAHQVIAALRKQFGGHAVQRA